MYILYVRHFEDNFIEYFYLKKIHKMSRRSQLFVGRLPLDSRERDIEAIFERYGSLVRCDLKYGK